MRPTSHVFSAYCACPVCDEIRLERADRARPLTIVDLTIGAIGAAVTTVWSAAVLALACAFFSGIR